MGNKETTLVVDIGDVHLNTKFSEKLVLKGVRHVSSLRYNLVSVEKLIDAGVAVCLETKIGILRKVLNCWLEDIYVVICTCLSR